MKRTPRRPEETIFNNQMVWQTVVSGVTIGAIALGAWYWLVRVEMVEEAAARNLVLLLMVLLQNVHVFNCRSESASAFRISIKRNVILVFGVLAAQCIHVLCMYLPIMQTTLGIAPVSLMQWMALLALALTVLLVMELFKWIRKPER